MRKPIQLILFIIVLTSLAACAPKLGIERLDDVQRAPTVGQLDIFDSREAVGRPYKTIAVLTMVDQRSARRRPAPEQDPQMAKLMDQVRQIGAEGVIVLEKGQTVQRIPDGMGGYVQTTVSRAKAEAIVYK